MASDGGPGSALIRMLRYVALGDSYTIGTSVGETERWPDQLVGRLGGALGLVANLGVNGYTSRDVVRDELPRLDRLSPEFASLLVGVNDVVQGVPAERFRADATTILDHLVARLPAVEDRHRGDARLHRHAAGRGLRRPDPPARRDRAEQRHPARAGRGQGDRVRGHLRHLVAGRRRPDARRPRRPPPERRPVRPLGRPDRAGRARAPGDR